MERPDVEEILHEAGIREKTIFYGVEDIIPSNIVWHLLSFIKRLTPNLVQFYKLPANKLHGVVTRIEILYMVRDIDCNAETKIVNTRTNNY